jgi:hypothetical protein
MEEVKIQAHYEDKVQVKDLTHRRWEGSTAFFLESLRRGRCGRRCQ